MKLAELLAPERVLVPLEAPNLREAGRLLAESLIASGLARDPEQLRQVTAAALPDSAVRIGGQAYLIHFRTDAVRQLAVALGVAPAPLARRREAQPRRGPRIAVLVAAPQRDAGTYLQVVSALAAALARREVVEPFLRANSPVELLTGGALGELPLADQLLIRDFMNRKVLSVRPDDTLARAAELMLSQGVPSLPVVGDSGEVVGMVTHREVLRYLLPLYVKRVTTGEFPAPPRPGAAGGTDLGTIPVREAMDRSVLCISEDDTLADAASLMVSKDLDRFPVVRDGVLVGFVTRGDVVRRLSGR